MMTNEDKILQISQYVERERERERERELGFRLLATIERLVSY
jgi:hypothetical protein